MTSRPKGQTEVGRWADLAVGAALALAGALAVVLLPDGNLLRITLAGLILFLVPGYLLIQALDVRPPSARTRLLQGLLSVGVSPGVVGILALSTALVPGGFRPAPIVAVVTLACLAFAATAYHRRSTRTEKRTGTPPQTGSAGSEGPSFAGPPPSSGPAEPMEGPNEAVGDPPASRDVGGDEPPWTPE